MVRVGLTKKVTFEQSLKGDKDTNVMKPGQEPFWQRELLDHGPCQGCWKNSKEDSVAGEECARGRV